MNNEQFDEIVESRLKKIQEILLLKRSDYAAGDRDRLHNFHRAADMLNCTAAKALVGMWTKHVISILDMVDDLPHFNRTEDYIDEKIGDAINYLILLEAMLKEKVS